MTKKIKMGKRYCSNKDEVRVICVDAPGDYPVIALDQNGDPFRYSSDGIYSGNWAKFNLVEIKPKKKKIKVWAQIKNNKIVSFSPTKNEAKKAYRLSGTKIKKVVCKYIVEDIPE